MSELQIGLLLIGLAVVLVVYGYGAWQQFLYRRRFGSAFGKRQDDALYQAGQPDKPAQQEPPADGEDALIAPEHWSPDLGDEEDICVTLDPDCDYIAELSLAAPVRASVLVPFWQRRFDFGKNVQVCGLSAEDGSWSRVVAESKPLFTSFRLAMQLVDRNGPAGEGQLRSFSSLASELARELDAELDLPDVDAAVAGAVRFDEFCAEVDHMIGLNIMPEGHELLRGSDVARVAEDMNMELQPDGAFHLLDASGHTRFILSNLDSVPFQRTTLEQMDAFGLSLQLDVPRTSSPAQSFDEMLRLARAIGDALGAGVVDDYRATLTDAGIDAIRNQVLAIERKMLARSITPGSALALRLFS